MSDFFDTIQGTQASDPCARFLNGMLETVNFVFFVTDLATRADQMRSIAAKALADTATSDAEQERYRGELDADEKIVTNRLRSFRQTIFQMLISRSVDHYLTYISELLSAIFLLRPETLRSGEQVRVDFVLQHGTLEEVVGALAERRVERLAYQGIEELSDYLQKELGFGLFDDSEDLATAVRIVEDRNVIVHNHAVANNKYVKKVKLSSFQVGEVLEFDFEPVFADLEFLAKAALSADGRAAQKWGIAQSSIKNVPFLMGRER